ncbi:Alpha 1,4-glycosyltransferase domain [Dillenia turbinata]|uniref:Alpha 1,4-glycosyltransferase domain n=1 Tax=Dillenia turbinata TaxID=194707 RepID=A0AAN8VIB2_9MAGN
MRKNRRLLKILKSKPSSSRAFSARVKEFFNGSSSNSSKCKVSEGFKILRPFYELGFRVIAISPDFDFIFKNTLAKSRFDILKKGNVEPGEVSIVIKSFGSLRNVIGARTMDLESGNWSRLNNAVMVFDEKHPLLYKFIEEFALTFDGNKWGHNGPYLVSRVVARVSGRPGFNFTVLAPSAFYLVDRRSVPGQTRKLKIEEESIISHILSIINHILKDSCVFCNSSAVAKLWV